jgi:hypothetical protein
MRGMLRDRLCDRIQGPLHLVTCDCRALSPTPSEPATLSSEVPPISGSERATAARNAPQHSIVASCSRGESENRSPHHLPHWLHEIGTRLHLRISTEGSRVKDILEPEDPRSPTTPSEIVPAMAANSSTGSLSAAPGECETCGSPGSISGLGGAEARSPKYVYAIGNVGARFPNLSVEKEFAQVLARTETAGMTDQQSFYAVLSDRENRYLVRQLCWVLSIQSLDTYLLLAREPGDLDLLVETIRPTTSPNDMDVVIGIRGPIAPPDMCNGLMVPIVMVDQVYSFDRATLIKSVPKPKGTTEAAFRPAAEEVLDRLMQLTDNAGATDEHRVLNYLAMRYPAIYDKAAEQFGLDFSLTGVHAQPAPLNGTRQIVDVILAFTNRNTDFTEKYSVRVDVTEEFPFLVAKMSPYYDR